MYSAGVQEESCSSLKSSKNYRNERNQSISSSKVENREEETKKQTEDKKLRNQLEKIYLKKQSLRGPLSTEQASINESRGETSFYIKRPLLKPSMLEQKLNRLR